MMCRFEMMIVRHLSPQILDCLNHLVIIAMVIMIARLMMDLTIMMIRVEGVVKHMGSVFLLKKHISPMLCKIKTIKSDSDLDIRMRSC